jgi:hypothetical protein
MMEMVNMIVVGCSGEEAAAWEWAPRLGGRIVGPTSLSSSQVTQQIQTGICYHAWQLNLILSFLSLLLWSMILVSLGSMAIMQIDRERNIRQEEMCKNRMEFVYRMIKIKVSYKK